MADANGEASNSLDRKEASTATKKGKKSRTIELQRFYLEVTDGSAAATPVPLPNCDYTIHIDKNDKETLLHKGLTNDKGEIVDLAFKNIPLTGASLKIRYSLGNMQRGYVQKYNKKPYSFVFTLRLGGENTINYSDEQVRFGKEKVEESFFYNFQAARINYYFDQGVNWYSEAVEKVNQLFPNTAEFEAKPININFEKGQYLDESNAFSRNGHDGSGVPDIVVGDRSDKIFDTDYLMHNVMHEWTHWTMYEAFEMPSGDYDSHYGTNDDPQISYKEGWALFVGDVFADIDSLKADDMLVQKDNEKGVNRLYGKSTNLTVQHVLYDLYDAGSNDEAFSISERFLDDALSEDEVKQLNFGLLSAVMIESRATTLQEFLTYLEDKYVITRSDKEKFAQVLKINGLSRNGKFSLNSDEGSPKGE